MFTGTTNNVAFDVKIESRYSILVLFSRIAAADEVGFAVALEKLFFADFAWSFLKRVNITSNLDSNSFAAKYNSWCTGL